MSELSLAYRLAEDVHSSFWTPGKHLTPTEIQHSGVRTDVSELSKTERLFTQGQINSERVYQHLSRSPKTGYYYLSTVFTKSGGAVRRAQITQEAESKFVPILAQTLFMKAILKIAAEREPQIGIVGPESPEVSIGDVYEHYSGTTYAVDAVVARAEGYEKDGQLGVDVIYTQLDDGEVNPAGTQYTRTLDEFVNGTVEVEGRQVSIFQRLPQ